MPEQPWDGDAVAPVRACCGQRHFGPQCPDGLVMCCLCFDRYPVAALATDDGFAINVCMACHEVAS